MLRLRLVELFLGTCEESFHGNLQFIISAL